ncbi:MAG: hypothetical protein V1817_04525 [Candidatus Micrarchaeota archaeon]
MTSLFSKASKVPLVTWLHMIPVVGMVFGPFDVVRAAQQQERIESLSDKTAAVLKRDVQRAVAIGNVPRQGPNSIEFAPTAVAAKITSRANMQRKLALRVNQNCVKTLVAQRAINRGQKNLVPAFHVPRDRLPRR